VEAPLHPFPNYMTFNLEFLQLRAWGDTAQHPPGHRMPSAENDPGLCPQGETEVDRDSKR
jgi:hypothetical protein